MSRALDALLRPVLTGMHWALKGAWFFARPQTFGAHAVPLTPEGRLILVYLRYAGGWRVPGGRRHEKEPPIDAALRELCEEIGMTSHGEASLACDFEELTDFKRDTESIVVVRDVRYRPRRWSWEVEKVGEFDPDRLPDDLAEVTARWIGLLRPCLMMRAGAKHLANRASSVMGRYGPPDSDQRH